MRTHFVFTDDNPTAFIHPKRYVMQINTPQKYFLSVAALLTPLLCSTSHAEGYEKTLSLQDISFTVTCPNNSSLNQLTIIPSGLTNFNSVMVQEIDGIVTGMEVGDINSDGSPEIYVYINSVGSGSYGSLVAYSANNKKSLSSIYLPPLDDDAKNSKGYMGHDQYSLVENTFSQRFPIYNQGDTNAKPTGGMRQLSYKLVKGEAGWQLALQKVQDIQ